MQLPDLLVHDLFILCLALESILQVFSFPAESPCIRPLYFRLSVTRFGFRIFEQRQRKQSYGSDWQSSVCMWDNYVRLCCV